MSPAPLEIGFTAPQDRQQVAELEALGADSLWVGGHIASTNPSPEAIIWLARLVEQTERVPVGTATLLLPLYPPAIVAKQIADLDRAAAGRLRLGIGVGGEYLADFGAAEVPDTSAAAAPMRPSPCCGILDGRTGHPSGRHHTFENIRIHPAPAQTGRAARSSSAAANPSRCAGRPGVGNGWMPYLYSPERYARSVTMIREEAERHGRDLTDFGWYSYVFVSIDDDQTVAATDAQAISSDRPTATISTRSSTGSPASAPPSRSPSGCGLSSRRAPGTSSWCPATGSRRPTTECSPTSGPAADERQLDQ